jgi:hypothetical protein
MKDPLHSPQDRSAPARTRLRALSAGLCTASVLASAGLAASQPLDADAVRAEAAATSKSTPRAGRPDGANPYLSFLPAEAKPDYPAWSRWLGQQGKAKRATQPASDPTQLILAGESEDNDTQASANPITGFGTGTGDDPDADVTGTIDPPAVPTLIGPFAEDDGSIPLASPTGLPGSIVVQTSQSIGDGPYGSGGTGTGDYDFFALPGLAAGDEIVIDVDTPLPFCCDLDPWVNIWDAAGNLLAFNDDQPAGGTYDSYLVYPVPAAGTYYVSVGAYQSPYPVDRFDSSSGTGFTTEGTYDIRIGVDSLDRDFFSLALEPGDVIAANVLAAAGTRVTLFDPSSVQRIGSGQDATAMQPGPFPAGGAATLAYVVETAGSYAVAVTGTSGAYTLELRAFRPQLETLVAGATQTLFVDFDGATVDPSIFGGAPGNVVLSPLSSFLSGWGLLPADENAVIDGILAVIEENLSTDMRVLGLNGDYDVSNLPGDFDVVILNSRDHVDPFGDPNVSRLIIGGTIPELGIGTIGIAESIDPGNFATSETAVVLLDLLSAPSPDPNSLNQFPLGGSATQVDLVTTGVGNVAAHEAGHFFANFHTFQFNALPSIMDQGGFLANTVGVGPDLTFGTGDDVDVDFEQDTYSPNEGFTGLEDTLNAVAFGLSTGTQDCAVNPMTGCRTAIKSSLLIKDNGSDPRDQIIFKWLKGQAVTQGELGDPTTSATYRLCVYDADGLVRTTSAPAAGLCDGDFCWEATGPSASPTGLRYRDTDLTPDGTQSVIVKSGAFPKPKLIWKAKGALLGDEPLVLTPPVVVQVINTETPDCLTQTYNAGDVSKNTAQQFKAGTP